MTRLKSLIRSQWLTIMMAMGVGIFLAPAGQTWWHSVQSYYDDARPIVRMQGLIVKTDAESVWVTVAGEKLRDCAYVRVQSYFIDKAGQMRDAYARREDMPERGDTRPEGRFSIGTWRIWPNDGAAAVRMYVVHNCAGRLVTTQIAEVML